MRILLDTHTLVWALHEPGKLTLKIKDLLANVNNMVFISVASLWELQIKRSLGKITLPDNFITQLQECGYELLTIKSEHISQLEDVLLIHRDPFDRMLIAQSAYENIPLVTTDSEILKYDIEIIRF